MKKNLGLITALLATLPYPMPLGTVGRPQEQPEEEKSGDSPKLKRNVSANYNETGD